jgi:uncharacterized protein (DUF952 family)
MFIVQKTCTHCSSHLYLLVVIDRKRLTHKLQFCIYAQQWNFMHTYNRKVRCVLYKELEKK